LSALARSATRLGSERMTRAEPWDLLYATHYPIFRSAIIPPIMCIGLRQ
jgi:hypothetical protein